MNWRPQKYTQISNALRRYFFQVDLIFDRKTRDYKIENKDFYQQWYSLTVCKYIHSSIGASLAVFWYWFQILYAWIVRYTLKWRLIYMFQHCMIAILSKYTILTLGTQNWNLWHSDQFDHLLPRVTDSSVGRDLSLEIQGA